MPGAFEHDGFYLRFGAGFGGVADSLWSGDENSAGEHANGTVTGVGSVGELMIGGAIAPRLILGGGFWGSTLLVSDFSQGDEGNRVPGDLQEPDSFGVTGVFVDWYFGSQGRALGAGGMHAQGGLGVAFLSGHRPEQIWDDDRIAAGPGVVLAFGYDWWVHEQWKLGVLARLTAGGLIEEDDRDDLWYHAVATLPSLVFSATYN